MISGTEKNIEDMLKTTVSDEEFRIKCGITDYYDAIISAMD